MPQVGSEHRLYLGYDSMPADLSGLGAGAPNIFSVNQLIKTDGEPLDPSGTPVTINTLLAASQLQLYDTIRDVSVGGTNNTVDTTVREDARQGFSTQLIATSSGEMTLQARYEPVADADMAIIDKGFIALMIAFLTKQEIFAIDLDKSAGSPTADSSTAISGAAGLAGNWSVGFGNPKPVQDLVVVDFQLTLSGKGQYVFFEGVTDNEFQAMVDPT